jgi:hypothetical protein
VVRDHDESDLSHAERFPPVNWQEVQDHLLRHLQIDPEWSVVENERLTWWPWLLPQVISVTGRGIYEEGSTDNFLRVTATTEVCTVDDAELGFALAEDANEDFPFGAFIFGDGILSATSSLALNPFCRPLLDQLRSAALIQTTLAHQLAEQLADRSRSSPEVTVLGSPHPQSGWREEPDELLRIYGGDTFRTPAVPDLAEHLAEARPYYRDQLLEMSFTAGFSDEEVDYFNLPGIDVAVGRRDDGPWSTRYGLGLVVYSRFLLPREEGLAPADVNMMNEMISNFAFCSQLGCVSGGEWPKRYGASLRTFLDYAFLATVRGHGPEELATSIMNAVFHSSATVRVLADELA